MGVEPPVPVKSATCVPVPSMTVIWALRVPAARGEKVTLMVHWERAGTEAPQVLVWAKSLGSSPVMVMLVMVSGLLSPLFRVIVFAALVVLNKVLGKIRPAGLSATPPEAITLETKASQLPPGVSCVGLESGKSREHVWPVTNRSEERRVGK